jgi:oligoribonuclease NrnB/cAMP/cGMP phosphodiesterase (DHH superfamily)
MLDNLDLELERSSKNIVLYHKDCMDGLSSAFIASEYFNYFEESCECISVQYGENLIQKLIDLNCYYKEYNLIFVDFSAPREILKTMAENVKSIMIIDHHKTAQADLEGIEEEISNICVYFDMNHSGAVLTYIYFTEQFQGDRFIRLPAEANIYFDYIQDRDLWKWELPYSEEVSEFLRLKVIPNNVEEFGNLLRTIDINEAKKIGSILLESRNKQVSSKIKKTKLINICGIEFHSLNATENISEIGNEICKKYDRPALMYFITEAEEVVLSFRSMDHLPDVSTVAKFFGGGGHRNACGAGKLSISLLQSILNNEFHNFNLDSNKKQLMMEF